MLANQFLANNGLYLPNYDSKSILQLLVLPSSWECKQGYSAMITIKTKNQNHLSWPSHNSQCAVSVVSPCIKQLVQEKQIAYSHKYIILPFAF